MAATNAPATDEKLKATEPVVAGAAQNDAAEETEGGETKQETDKLNEQAVAATYTEGADRRVATADGTIAPNVPKADITADAITFTAPPEKKSGGFMGFLRGVKDVAVGAVEAVGGALKSAYDAAAGVVNSVLDSAWKKEFGPEAQIKVTEKEGKVTHLTATDGLGDRTKVINSDGKVTTVSDTRGNTTYFDGNESYATDKDGGKYTIDKATGDSIYTAKDGSKVIQHKDGKREFIDKSGNRMEQGDGTLTQQFDNLHRTITDKRVIDRVKTYHNESVEIINHGNVPPESVPEAERNRPGVHQYGTQTEKVEEDGFKTVQGKDGRRRFGHCRDGKMFDVKEGPDGKPEFYRNGEKVDFDKLPEWMQRRFRAARDGSSETKVDGVAQVKVATTPDGKPSTTVGDVTIAATPNGGIKTEVQTGPKPEDKLTYTNEPDGKQTGPGQDGRRFIFDTDNKEAPYTEVNEKGETVLKYNANTNTLWTPEYTSTPDGVALANGNFIHSDGTVSAGKDGPTILSGGYSSSSPEYQFANAQVITAVGFSNNIIGQAKANPAGMSESAIEGCISDLGKALAQCLKTGNYERLNQIFGAIADAYGALAEVKVAKAREQQRQYAIANADDEFERLNAANRVA